MEQVRSYLLSVTAVCMIAVLCMRVVSLPRMKAVLRFVTGILILLVAVSALVSLDAEQIEQLARRMEWSLDLKQEDLEKTVNEQLSLHVKETAENYIEKYAQERGILVQAKVSVSEDQYPVPYAVTIIGTMTPQQKYDLERYLTQSLNIPTERQEWK